MKCWPLMAFILMPGRGGVNLFLEKSTVHESEIASKTLMDNLSEDSRRTSTLGKL